jgi:hypothetical protein
MPCSQETGITNMVLSCGSMNEDRAGLEFECGGCEKSELSGLPSGEEANSATRGAVYCKRSCGMKQHYPECHMPCEKHYSEA